MSLTALFVFGILTVDFVIYYWFHRVFGDKRAILAREVALLRAQLPALRGPAENPSPNTIPPHQKSVSFSARALNRTIPTLELPRVNT